MRKQKRKTILTCLLKARRCSKDREWDEMDAVGREFGSGDSDRLMEQDRRDGVGIFDPDPETLVFGGVKASRRGEPAIRGQKGEVVKRPIIALDADGVLLDYGTAYAHVWRRAFGVFPDEVDPEAYWPIDRWAVDRLDGERLEHFRRHFDEGFWSSIPAIRGAVEATHSLSDAGYELVCVSALDPQFEGARLRNLRDLGLPIERVIATSRSQDVGNPKADAIKALCPVAFVDDYLPYLTGLPSGVHTALLRSHATGSPNRGTGLKQIQSQHKDLAAFARWWLGDCSGAKRP